MIWFLSDIDKKQTAFQLIYCVKLSAKFKSSYIAVLKMGAMDRFHFVSLDIDISREINYLITLLEKM